MTALLDCLFSEFDPEAWLGDHKVVDIVAFEVKVFVENKWNGNVHASDLVLDVEELVEFEVGEVDVLIFVLDGVIFYKLFPELFKLEPQIEDVLVWQL
jgi:hypothetical protein